MKKVVLGAVVAGATAVAIKRFGSFNEGAKEPIHIRSDKHDPTRERRVWAGQRVTIPVNAHYCGEVHQIGDLCVEDLYLDSNVYGNPLVPSERDELTQLREEIAKMKRELRDAQVQAKNDEATITRLGLRLNHERTKLATIKCKLDQTTELIEND